MSTEKEFIDTPPGVAMKADTNVILESKELDRRRFLLNILKQSGRVTLATGFIYSVSLVTSKNGISAGAK